MRVESNVDYVPPMRLMYPCKGGILFSVGQDEPVYAVQEGYHRNRDGTEERRYQVLLMPRGDVVAGFWTDLGPASDFVMQVDGESYAAPPYHQIVLLEHSVAECQHMAEQGRMDDFAVRLLHEQVNESDLFERYAQMIEQDMYLVKNRSTFGPGGFTQRNGYSHYAAAVAAERLKANGRYLY